MMNDAQIHTMKEAARYGDIGPLLASVIPTAFPLSSVRIKKAVETNRATVIGAGMQSMEVSGATVHVQKELLPIRNIPLLKVKTSKKGEWSSLEFSRRLREKIGHAKEVVRDSTGNCPSYS
jgi:ethanolamine utilization protein EutA